MQGIERQLAVLVVVFLCLVVQGWTLVMCLFDVVGVVESTIQPIFPYSLV